MRQQIRIVSLSPIPGWRWLAKNCRDRRLTSVLFLAWGLGFAYQAFFDSNRTWTVPEDLFSPSRTDSKYSYWRMILVPRWCCNYAWLTVTRWLCYRHSICRLRCASSWMKSSMRTYVFFSLFQVSSRIRISWGSGSDLAAPLVLWIMRDPQLPSQHLWLCQTTPHFFSYGSLNPERTCHTLTGLRVLAARLPFATMEICIYLNTMTNLAFKDPAWWLHDTQGLPNGHQNMKHGVCVFK